MQNNTSVWKIVIFSPFLKGGNTFLLYTYTNTKRPIGIQNGENLIQVYPLATSARQQICSTAPVNILANKDKQL